jgi:nitrite reductase (NADH) large subunit
MAATSTLGTLDRAPTYYSSNIVVIGGGPVGMRAATALALAGRKVAVLSSDPYEPYNRVKLTPLLAGDVQFGEITTLTPQAALGNLELRSGTRVTVVDRAAQVVETADGQVWSYNTLIIATGSRAFIPGIPGRDLPGVYTFRSAEDVSALLARSFSAKRVVVIGGGLLGLEAARGMQRRQVQVTVVEHENRVMPRQLDEDAGALLADRITDLGVAVQTGVAVRQIAGSDRVEAVHLANGDELPCDTVIVCTGVRANVGLAQDARLAFGRGITVDDAMRTSDPNIYAIGECVEHDGHMHGLVGPGFEQADVAVAQILGAPKQYVGSIPATKLKVIGAEVFSVGEVEQLDVETGVKSHIWRDEDGYRRIFVRSGRLVGALSVGDWPQASRVQTAVQDGALVYPWQIGRFRRHGLLWPDGEEDVTQMADGATVCNCTGVSCGLLRAAVASGANTVEALGAQTGAGAVCGSCQPMLEELVNAGAPPKPVALFKPLLVVSVLATLGALALALLPRIPLPDSFDADSLRVWLWRDNITRQWTGFILLGLTLTAMLIGLRKRIRFMDRLGSYDIWRLVHLAIGVFAAVALVVHTGLRAGSNLNLILFAVFTLNLTLGAAAGLTTGGDHALRACRIGTARKPVRRIPVWLHILAVWPLPVLIGAHVLASYAF